MRNYSKLFGAGTGVLVAQVLKVFIPEQQAQGIGTALDILLPIVGTYIAPANQPAVAGPEVPTTTGKGLG
jgi:hypothetical protein